MRVMRHRSTKTPTLARKLLLAPAKKLQLFHFSEIWLNLRSHQPLDYEIKHSSLILIENLSLCMHLIQFN